MPRFYLFLYIIINFILMAIHIALYLYNYVSTLSKHSLSLANIEIGIFWYQPSQVARLIQKLVLCNRPSNLFLSTTIGTYILYRIGPLFLFNAEIYMYKNKPFIKWLIIKIIWVRLVFWKKSHPSTLDGFEVREVQVFVICMYT